MPDPINEYSVSQLKEYKSKKLVCITKKGLEIDEDEEEKKLCEEEINFLGSSQALRDSSMESYISSKKILEINPHHSIIKSLKTKVEADKNDKIVKDLIWLLFETSLVHSAQALRDSSMESYMSSKKILEINPHHSIIKSLKTKVEANKNDKIVKDLIWLLFETSLIQTNKSLEDNISYTDEYEIFDDLKQEFFCFYADNKKINANLKDLFVHYLNGRMYSFKERAIKENYKSFNHCINRILNNYGITHQEIESLIPK
ncbi:Hsp90 protein [Gigaspora rosea]|uniref:Hsp90 protein n=1 Tax=Gigaspora rosea TaxID=44941 RepID=A0A397VF60_9GLOM|nr:Hsp90 protein [Gigaspora rosea]